MVEVLLDFFGFLCDVFAQYIVTVFRRNLGNLTSVEISKCYYPGFLSST